MERKNRSRVLSFFLVVIVMLFFSSEPAAADIRSVVVDSTEIALEAKNDGSHTGTVTLINLTDSPIRLATERPLQADATTEASADDESDPGCTVTLSPSELKPGLQTEVTVAFGAGCDVTGGRDVTLWYGEGEDEYYLLKATPSTTGVNWGRLFYSFLIGFGAAFIGFFAIWVRLRLHNRGKAAVEKIGLWKSLEHLGTDWSFKDNWLTSLTLVSGALVGLLGTSGALGAILGSEPSEDVLGYSAIAGAASAIFAVVSPLFAKGLRKEETRTDLREPQEMNTHEPTVLGTLLAAFVALVGTLGLVCALTWEGYALTLDLGPVRWVILFFGAFVGVVIVWYAWTELWRVILRGTSEPDPELSVVEEAVKRIADKYAPIDEHRASGDLRSKRQMWLDSVGPRRNVFL